MSRVRVRNWRGGAGYAVAALALTAALTAALTLGGGAWAQVQTAPDQSENPSTFRLPAPTRAPPRAAGPADDSGVAPTPIAPKSAVPSTVPSSVPSAAPPVIVLPVAKPKATPEARPSASASRVPRVLTAPPRPAPSTILPAPVASPGTPPIAVPSVAPSASAEPSAPAPAPAAPAPAPAAAQRGPAPWLLAALVALLALAAGGFAVRRRRAPLGLPAPDFVGPEVAAAPKASAAPDTPAAPENNVMPGPIAVPLPDFAGPAAPAPAPLPVLSLALEATRMSATLFNATLAYRLVITNTGAAPLSGIEIGGDMISAHASRPTEEQLGLDGATLVPLHGVGALAPGEAVVLGGDLRLPLSAILPIRRGDAQLFVPLARFCVQALGPDGRTVSLRRAFLVGQSRSAAADKLQPFRLDLGPRLYSEVGQRAL